jgi:hypothetical protein
MGLEPFPYINIYDNNVFGTFGNPNFQSAFIGILGTYTFTIVFDSRLNVVARIFFGLISILTLFGIYSTNSWQGFFNLAAGVVAALVLLLFRMNQTRNALAVLSIGILGAITTALGILNFGPLASALAKASLAARRLYWEAAVNLMLQHPLFGVGFDGFGDWYRRSRTREVANFNVGISADTAHNIPLDIGSGGGIPLLLIYLAFVVLALLSIVKILKRTTSFDLVFTSIAAAWFAYQAQSLISINQIGIGVWGWSLTGLLIGYELQTREPNGSAQEKTKSKTIRKEQISAIAVVSSFFFGSLGLAAGVPPYLAADKFYKALQSGDALKIQPAAYLKPNERSRYLYVANIMISNKLDDRAIQVLRDASLIYPDSFELWQMWSNIPTSTPDQIARAKSEMRRLDPYNKDIK